jgi:hypothetical protein
MKRLRLTAGHHPPANPSFQHQCNTVWLAAFAESKAQGPAAIKAADRAEREFRETRKNYSLTTN